MRPDWTASAEHRDVRLQLQRQGWSRRRSYNSCLIRVDCCILEFTGECRRYKSEWLADISCLHGVSLPLTFALRHILAAGAVWRPLQFDIYHVHVRRGLALSGEHPVRLREIRLNPTGSLHRCYMNLVTFQSKGPPLDCGKS